MIQKRGTLGVDMRVWLLAEFFLREEKVSDVIRDILVHNLSQDIEKAVEDFFDMPDVQKEIQS